MSRCQCLNIHVSCPGLHVSMSPCVHISMSMSPCVHISMSMSPCLRVSVSMSQSPHFSMSVSPCFHVSMSPSLCIHVSKSMSSCFWNSLEFKTSQEKFRPPRNSRNPLPWTPYCKRKTELTVNDNLCLFATNGNGNSELPFSLLQTEKENGRLFSLVANEKQ